MGEKNFSVRILVLILTLLLADTAWSKTLYVRKTSSECPANSAPDCYTDFSQAVTNSASGDTIQVGPGTHPTRNVTLTRSVSISGTETANTVLNGDGLGAVLTISGVASVMNVQRLTFIRAGSGSPALLVQNSQSVKINNNIFDETGTGVEVAGSPTTEITNNTFYLNSSAIVSDATALNIVNNIFFQAGGATAITPNVELTSIKNNLFFGGTVGPDVVTVPTDPSYKDNIVGADPLLVDPEAGDFHLKSGSPAIDAGDPSVGSDKIDTTDPDIGAYGGPNEDTFPFPVSGLLVTSTTGSSISIAWDANTNYLIGGYKVYSGNSSGNYGSMPADAGLVTSYTFTDASVASQPTGTPVLWSSPANRTLLLYWDTSAVRDATGYEIRFGVSSPLTTADAGNATQFALTGLENGQPYQLVVLPYAEKTLYLAVKAYYSSNASFVSDRFSNEVSSNGGDRLYGPASNTVEDFPERLEALPDLPNEGCFIATAAYGYYAAPHVQALRHFRDRYLLTHAAGKVFVEWYYRRGPIAANVINDHPWLKPVVRLALLPVVALAVFMTNTGLPEKLVVSADLILVIWWFLVTIYRRKKPAVRRHAGSLFLFVTALLLMPATTAASEPGYERPHWSLELKGGLFTPDIDNWSGHYGRRSSSRYGGSLAYKLTGFLEIGLGGAYGSDSGRALAPGHTLQEGAPVYSGEVTTDHYPLNVFVLARGVVSDDQWLVPYVGGGWTRIYYRQKTQYQGVARGKVDGYHARAGIQVLLNGIDRNAANKLFRDYGVFHTYLFFEAEFTRAMLDIGSQGSVNLGGTGWLGGLLFEF